MYQKDTRIKICAFAQYIEVQDVHQKTMTFLSSFKKWMYKNNSHNYSKGTINNSSNIYEDQKLSGKSPVQV